MTSQSDSRPPGPRTAIVLAGRRSADDPLARATGAPHRALLDIEGEPMLARVVRVLLAWPTVEQVLVNIDEPDLVRATESIAGALEAGRVELQRSTPSPSGSVLESLERADLSRGPALVTTADHALLDSAMLDAFFARGFAGEADLAVGLVARRTIEARFPEARRTYLRFRDEAYSGANLFLFRNTQARRAVEFWRRVEHERKRPWRIARAFGWANLALFLTRRLDLDTALERASDVVGAEVRAVRLPMAEAAVDVDKLEDLELVREILAGRRAPLGGGERDADDPR